MNYSSISTTEYKGGYAFITSPRSKHFCSKGAFWQGCPAEEAPKFSCRGNMFFFKLRFFTPLLDHIWTTDFSVCTGMNERSFQGRQRERRSRNKVEQRELSFTHGMWDVSKGGTFSSPSCPADLCNAWVRRWSATLASPQRAQQLQWDERPTHLTASPCLPSSRGVVAVLSPFKRLKRAAF